MSEIKLRFQPGNTLPQVDPPRSPRETLPTMYDLPSEYPEEPGLPDEFHDLQPQLLSRTLSLPDYSRDNWFSASDLNVYYDVNHALWHKRPDWFLVVGVPRLYEGNTLRRSYVTWQEGASPYVVVEFLSTGTERGDLGRFYTSQPAASENEPLPLRSNEQPPEKLEMYERFLRVPHYIVYSRHNQTLRYFRLTGGVYEEHPLQSGNCSIWLTELGVGLGLWQGEFDGVPSIWLRWCDQHGTWFLTDTEQEQRAKEQSQTQLLQAAKNLLTTGMSLEQVTELLALTDKQVNQLNNL